MEQPKHNCNCKKIAEGKSAAIAEALKLASILGAGIGINIVEVGMENEDEQPMSKKEWDEIRKEQLAAYIMECAAEGKKVNQELFVEYNQLVSHK